MKTTVKRKAGVGAARVAKPKTVVIAAPAGMKRVPNPNKKVWQKGKAASQPPGCDITGLRRQRKLAGLSQRKVAKEAGLSHVYLRDIEQGTTSFTAFIEWRPVIKAAIRRLAGREEGKAAKQGGGK